MDGFFYFSFRVYLSILNNLVWEGIGWISIYLSISLALSCLIYNIFNPWVGMRFGIVRLGKAVLFFCLE